MSSMHLRFVRKYMPLTPLVYDGSTTEVRRECTALFFCRKQGGAKFCAIYKAIQGHTMPYKVTGDLEGTWGIPLVVYGGYVPMGCTVYLAIERRGHFRRGLGFSCVVPA